MQPMKETEEVIEGEMKELLEMTRENNEILHGMRRRERIGNILKIFYIGFIILSFYGAYVFAEPYVKQAQGFISGANTSRQKLASSTLPIGFDQEQIKNVINLFNKSVGGGGQ